MTLSVSTLLYSFSMIALMKRNATNSYVIPFFSSPTVWATILLGSRVAVRRSGRSGVVVVVGLGFSSGHHPASRATNRPGSKLRRLRMFLLLSSIFYQFGCQVHPEENYVHRACVFNSLIKTNGTPDMVQCSKTAPHYPNGENFDLHQSACSD